MPVPISVLVVGDVSSWLEARLEGLRRDGCPVHVLTPDRNASRQQIIRSIKALPSAQYSAFVSLSHVLRPLDEEVIGLLLPAVRFITEAGAGYDDGASSTEFRAIS